MKILKIDLLFLERLQNVSLLRKDSTFVDLFLTGTSLSERCRHKTRENYHGYDDAVTEKWIPFRKTIRKQLRIKYILINYAFIN